jgi:hypothetical protein
MNRLTVPVVLCVFRRPDTTARVLEAILAARPERLYVFADGPRPDREGEAELCRQTRALVESAGSRCELITDFAPANLGLKRRMTSGIDRVFSVEERAIILEDDCLPEPGFFRFCEEMLARYEDDPRVMMVSGDNFLLGRHQPAYSYYFSHYVHIWGWATWRRAWHQHDPGMADWPARRASDWLARTLGRDAEVCYWQTVFDQVHAGAIDSWAYRWGYSCLARDGLSVVPERHLVTNLGVDAAATHTRDGTDPHFRARAATLAFPLRHPPLVARDALADRIEFDNLFGRPPRAVRMLRRMRRRWRRLTGRPGPP